MNGSWASGGGGGGAGEVGHNAVHPDPGVSGDGGDGLSNLIAGPENTGVGVVNPASPGRWFAGGGAGMYFYGTGEGGAGGGGSTSSPGAGDNGVAGTGGGGACGGPGGQGGSGIVIVRYKIAELEAEAKATGGSVSYYGNKTIHTFTSSGTFATKSSWSATDIEYVAVAGGGGSNNEAGGGAGGAGGFITGTTPIGAHPVSTTIQIGAGGHGTSAPDAVAGLNGNPSYVGSPLTAYGGGGGAAKKPAGNAGNGGSGGGGAGPSQGMYAGGLGDK